MRHKNHVSLIGQVGKDAEVRQTQGGVQYARFSLATTSGGYQRQDGQQVPEKTEWHSIVCWNKLAVFCGQYVKKGMKVDVEGALAYGEYTDQQGMKRQTVDIVASDIVLMTNPNNGQGQGQQGQQAAPQGQQQGGYQGYQAPPQHTMPNNVQPVGQAVYNQAPRGQAQQPFPPQVNPQTGQPVYQNQGGYQQQPAPQGPPGADALPF